MLRKWGCSKIQNYQQWDHRRTTRSEQTHFSESFQLYIDTGTMQMLNLFFITKMHDHKRI